MPASTERSNPPQPTPGNREEELEDAVLELEVISPDGTRTRVTCAALA